MRSAARGRRPVAVSRCRPTAFQGGCSCRCCLGSCLPFVLLGPIGPGGGARSHRSSAYLFSAIISFAAIVFVIIIWPFHSSPWKFGFPWEPPSIERSRRRSRRRRRRRQPRLIEAAEDISIYCSGFSRLPMTPRSAARHAPARARGAERAAPEQTAPFESGLAAPPSRKITMTTKGEKRWASGRLNV